MTDVPMLPACCCLHAARRRHRAASSCRVVVPPIAVVPPANVPPVAIVVPPFAVIELPVAVLHLAVIVPPVAVLPLTIVVPPVAVLHLAIVVPPVAIVVPYRRSAASSCRPSPLLCHLSPCCPLPLLCRPQSCRPSPSLCRPLPSLNCLLLCCPLSLSCRPLPPLCHAVVLHAACRCHRATCCPAAPTEGSLSCRAAISLFHGLTLPSSTFWLIVDSFLAFFCCFSKEIHAPFLHLVIVLVGGGNWGGDHTSNAALRQLKLQLLKKGKKGIKGSIHNTMKTQTWSPI